MFDVCWTDPSRETVGQRRSRKDQDKNSTASSRASSHRTGRARSIKSSRSVESASASFLDLFSPTYKRSASKREGIQSKSTSTLRLDNIEAHRPLSSYTIDETPSSSHVANGFFGSVSLSDTDSSLSEVSESMFSGRTSHSAQTIATWNSSVESTGLRSPDFNRVVQPLSSTSFVTQSTEITVSPRELVHDLEELSTIVRISSAGPVPAQMYGPPPTGNRSPSAPTIELPVSDDAKSVRSVTRKEKIIPQTTAWPITTRRVWQPPDVWECPSTPESDESPVLFKSKPFSLPSHPPRSSQGEVESKRVGSPTVEMVQLQRSIRRMEVASDRILLERLKEEWTEISDASVYRELEMEKQLWMLTAMRKRPGNRMQELPKPGNAKILSLFENDASCSTLSALAFANEIHHLSTAPLSPTSWSNVHPLTAPGPKPQLPYAADNFTVIHCFSLPALLPASSIPSMLKECHRTLVSGPSLPSSPLSPSPISPVSGGTLHLTVLDPAPLPSTLGPRLRAWLDEHLLLNLERQFRCINPGRLFPGWLADAGLRGHGSTILPIQFLACYSAARPVDPKASSAGGNGNDLEKTEETRESATRRELKSVVGRMIWKEIWGPFVEGGKWWWEDEAIVDECERMQTTWEYAIIEAVKQN